MQGKLVCAEVTQKIIGCAIEVHKALGPGFLEKFYEEALCIELDRARLPFERQTRIVLRCKGRPTGHHRLDLVVEKSVVVELKAVKKLEDVHFAVTLSYLKAAALPVALLLNFNAAVLAIKRFGNSVCKLNAEAQKRGSAEGLVGFLRNEGAGS